MLQGPPQKVFKKSGNVRNLAQKQGGNFKAPKQIIVQGNIITGHTLAVKKHFNYSEPCTVFTDFQLVEINLINSATC